LANTFFYRKKIFIDYNNEMPLRCKYYHLAVILSKITGKKFFREQ